MVLAELIIPGSGREVVVRTAAAFGLTADDLTGPSRYRRITRARNAVVWILRRQFNADGQPKSYPQLALLLGGRDHSSVMYGERRCAAWIEQDPAYRATVEALLAWLAPAFVPAFLSDPAEGPDRADCTNVRRSGSMPPVRVRAVADLPARQVKRKNALDDDDLGAVNRYNGTRALLAAILRMQRERVAA